MEYRNNLAFANINRPTAGAQQDKVSSVRKHPLQLYSLATPNGMKVTIMLEELLARGHGGAEYDAWLTNIGDGSQFASDFEPSKYWTWTRPRENSPPARIHNDRVEA